jgi:peptidyl-tRNA hydrolase, PTH1 family
MESERISERFVIVGLGNAGRSYQGNRHNVGFMLVDRLAAAHTISLSRVQQRSIVGDGRIAAHPAILAKPQTYMNLSGDAVGPLVKYYKIPLSNLLVVYDELDLPLGTLRLREKGGAGGHNGMRSIIHHLGDAFPRLRLGIGRPPGRMDPAAYVLQDFSRDEAAVVNVMLDQAVQAVTTYITDGITLAMSRFNGNVSVQT